jgi:hypothetical protein
MSETVTTQQPKPKTERSGSDDGRAFAQVEKWMEMIREVSREQVDERAGELVKDFSEA